MGVKSSTGRSYGVSLLSIVSTRLNALVAENAAFVVPNVEVVLDLDRLGLRGDLLEPIPGAGGVLVGPLGRRRGEDDEGRERKRKKHKRRHRERGFEEAPPAGEKEAKEEKDEGEVAE